MTAQLIAFQGETELLDASWSIDSGRQVSFRICGEAFDRVHPFKRFTQRRAGRVGTRFNGSIADAAQGQVRYQGDCMLASWGDSSAQGQHFKLWLDDEAERHPFAGFTRRKGQIPGELFAVVLVEVDDDETPINQETRQRAESLGPADPGVEPDGAAGVQEKPTPQPAPKKVAKLSSSVHLMVTGARYVRWLEETRAHLVKAWTPKLARDWTKQVLDIESMSDLDRDAAAIKRFHEKIRRPFETWNSQEPP